MVINTLYPPRTNKMNTVICFGRFIIFIAIITLMSFPLAPVSTAIADSDNKKYQYNFMFDNHMSSSSSAEIAMSAIETYRIIDDFLYSNLHTTRLEASCKKRKEPEPQELSFIDTAQDATLTILMIVSKFTVINWITVANHEIGGHGARTREFKFSEVSYRVKPFSGSTRFLIKEFNALNIYQQQALIIGGMETNYLLSDVIKTRYMESGKINSVYGLGYILSSLDQAIYINSTTNKSLKNESNDVSAYLGNINRMYSNNYLNIKKLRRYSYLDFLDPFLWYSFYSYIGCDDLRFPMIPVTSNFKYLLAFKLILAPYGPEKAMINHFKVNDDYYRLSLSYGKNQSFRSWSAKLSTNHILRFSKAGIGFDIGIWSQPQVIKSEPLQAKLKTGYMLLIKAEHTTTEKVSLLFAGGFKSSGFLQGMPLAESGMIRFGLKLNF